MNGRIEFARHGFEGKCSVARTRGEEFDLLSMDWKKLAISWSRGCFASCMGIALEDEYCSFLRGAVRGKG